MATHPRSGRRREDHAERCRRRPVARRGSGRRSRSPTEVILLGVGVGPSAAAQAIEASGATAKQHTALMASARGEFDARFRSVGVNVKPMDTMKQAAPERGSFRA